VRAFGGFLVGYGFSLIGKAEIGLIAAGVSIVGATALYQDPICLPPIVIGIGLTISGALAIQRKPHRA
jgi:hypothetical protein